MFLTLGIIITEGTKKIIIIIIHQRTWETYHHCHRRNKRDKLYLSASLSGNSERQHAVFHWVQHAVFHWVIHHRHGLNTKNNSSNNSDDNNNINK